MAILTISGAPASRFEDVAHGCSQLLGFEFVTESRLSQWMTEEFGETPVPDISETNIDARTAAFVEKLDGRPLDDAIDLWRACPMPRRSRPASSRIRHQQRTPVGRRRPPVSRHSSSRISYRRTIRKSPSACGLTRPNRTSTARSSSPRIC